MVRDRATLKPRGFAFVQFTSVEDATRAMYATHNKPLYKDGPILRCFYGRNVGPPGGAPAAAGGASIPWAQQVSRGRTVLRGQRPLGTAQGSRGQTVFRGQGLLYR